MLFAPETADELSAKALTQVLDLITGTPPIATTEPLPKSPLLAEKSLLTSLSTFALELDFWSSESFCYKSPNEKKDTSKLPHY